jgi:serine/threonine protein kinase/Tol biopolymer transport system component
MSSLTRTSLGPYEILSLLGAGGMGEVYRARDPRLGRVVAVKVLPSSLSADEKRLRRFEQEARAAGMLNHPNVLAIYDVGTHEGSPYLVSELLDGETLRARLEAGPIPLSKVFEYASQIAMGLAAAHDKGIVHRDLKPENLFLTRDGRVKILDFGLAKLTRPEMEHRTDAPTLPRDTDPGVAMGTVGYMSPEQVRGQEADARSDVFALGAIIYEMLSGRRAFRRDTPVETMNAILSEDPPEATDANPALTRLVRRCLEKRPEERFQSARDLAFALEALSGTSGASVAQPRTEKRRRAIYAWLLAAAFAVGVLALSIVHFREPPPDRNRYQFGVLPPEGAIFGANREQGFALSPDGRHLVFAASDATGRSLLYLRPLDASEARALPGTEGASYPFWSPDSRFVAFIASGKLKKIDIAGGPPQNLCDALRDRGGTWNRDGVILFAPDYNGPLYRISASGGSPAPFTTLDASREETLHRWPYFLPDGEHFFYVVRSSNPEHTGIYLGSLASGERRKLVSAFSSVAYVPPHLLYVRGTTLMAQPFDSSRLELSGEPSPVVERVGSFEGIGKASFSVSENGVLAHNARAMEDARSVWFDRVGNQLGAVAAPPESLSLDERKLAISRFDSQTGASDIWVVDLSRATTSRLTSNPAHEINPIWSPDGTRIVFSSNRLAGGGIDLFLKATAGGEEELLLRTGATNIATDWSVDGRFILYQALDARTKPDIWALPLEGRREPVALVQSPFSETDGRLSPDGRWLAYASDESGQPEIYVRPFLRPGESQLISRSGGRRPMWRGMDGRELFYVSPERRVMSASVESDSATFQASVPRQLFDELVFEDSYAVSRDGQRFLVNTVPPNASAPIQVVVNWKPEPK